MWALVADLAAARAEMFGMDAANIERMSEGKALAYDESAYEECRRGIEQIAKRLREL